MDEQQEQMVTKLEPFITAYLYNHGEQTAGDLTSVAADYLCEDWLVTAMLVLRALDRLIQSQEIEVVNKTTGHVYQVPGGLDRKMLEATKANVHMAGKDPRDEN